MNVWRLPRITFQALSEVKETRAAALITHPDWMTARAALNLPIVVQAEPVEADQELYDHLAASLPSAVEVIYALGESEILDAGKYVAHKTGKPLVIVPAMLTDDRALTADLFFVSEEVTTHIVTGSAEQVILDVDLLKAGPASQRTSALVEVLSIVTAMMDWGYAAQKGKLAADEAFYPWAAGLAAGIAQQAIKSAAAIGKGDSEGFKTLVGLLAMTVQIDNLLGHHRVSAGAEHIFAQAAGMTASTASLPHAERVAPGILLSAALHNRDVGGLRVALEAGGVRFNQIRKADILSLLMAMPVYVQQHHLPYTIFNDLDTNPEKLAESLVKSTLSA